MDQLSSIGDMGGGLLQPSRHFMAAAIKRCRWLPCAPVELSTEDQAAEGMPAVLALWSGDAQVGSNHAHNNYKPAGDTTHIVFNYRCTTLCVGPHIHPLQARGHFLPCRLLQGFMLAVGDIVRQPSTSDMIGFTDKLTVPHAGAFSDLQARISPCAASLLAPRCTTQSHAW